MKSASLLFVVCSVACACASSSLSTPEAKKPSAPVIAALKTHDGKISIVGGGKDLRVNVTKDDGTVVADNASLDELRTKDPETWMLLKSSLAQNSGTFIDATFHETPAPALK